MYPKNGRRKTVFLEDVGPRIRLADHALTLATAGVAQRPQFRMLPTAGRTYIDAEAWINIGWYSFFSTPADHTTPIFFHATNDALPDTWMSEVADYLAPL